MMKIIEATMILPVTCLIIVGLIALMMTFYTRFQEQCELHDTQRPEIYQTREVQAIRAYDLVRP